MKLDTELIHLKKDFKYKSENADWSQGKTTSLKNLASVPITKWIFIYPKRDAEAMLRERCIPRRTPLPAWRPCHDDGGGVIPSFLSMFGTMSMLAS
jgi:hypothetical protein